VREIKFRAWDALNGKMFYPAMLDISRDDGIWVYEKEKELWHLLPPVMLFTGLRDKNGMEIFGDDILGSWEDEEWWVYGIVTYSDYNGAYYLADEEGSATDWDMADEPSEWNKLEVIGNKYQNPGLLKEWEEEIIIWNEGRKYE